MNIIFNAILFYIYSGIALCGLCSGKATELVGNVYAPADDNEEQTASRAVARGRVVQCAQEIGALMTDAATTSIIASNNNTVIQNYEAAKAHNERILKDAETLSPKGS